MHTASSWAATTSDTGGQGWVRDGAPREPGLSRDSSKSQSGYRK